MILANRAANLVAVACGMPSATTSSRISLYPGLLGSHLKSMPSGGLKSSGRSRLTSSGFCGRDSRRDSSAARATIISLILAVFTAPFSVSQKASGRSAGRLGAVGVEVVGVGVDAGETAAVTAGAAGDGDGAAGAGEDGTVGATTGSVINSLGHQPHQIASQTAATIA